MIFPDSDKWSLGESQQVLKAYGCVDIAPEMLFDETLPIQRSLLSFAEVAETLTLGICSDSVEEGFHALKSYVQALYQPLNFDLPPRIGAVYIKFNSRGHQWSLENYTGRSRGVLVSFHFTQQGEMNGTYGYFPLDLFPSVH